MKHIQERQLLQTDRASAGSVDFGVSFHRKEKGTGDQLQLGYCNFIVTRVAAI